MKDSFNVHSVWGNYLSVVNGLKAVASESQADLLSVLSEYEGSGNVSDVKSFWIINAIAMKATPSVIEEVAGRADVDYVKLDEMRTIPPVTIGEREGIQAIEWNINRVRAPEVWAMGYKGTGVVVGSIDTGVDVTHPALSSRYRGGSNSWYDAVNGQANPYDDNGHGTHTIGTMVGDDGGTNQIGVAPGAKFISAKACSGGGSCADSWLLSAGQWIMDPDGNPATPDYPVVVNNSWGGGECDPWYRTMVTNWRAGGLFPSFSAGNSGPDVGTIGSPGDYPESFAVGATDSSDTIAWFSSRGPSCYGEIKPEVTAPGVNIRSSVPGGSYQSWQGTSMAAPHVSGCVALLKQIDPNLTVDSLENILESTAVDLGPAGKDNDYGSGRIDCYEAALSVIGPPPGGPDLIVTALSAPSSATAGGSITVSNSVKNQGDQTAQTSKVGFYLSSNNNPLIVPSDVFIGSRDVPKSTTPPCPWRWCNLGSSLATGLAPGETSADNTKLIIPSNTSQGTYYLKARADYQDVVSETDETNNIMVSGAMTISPKPPCSWWRCR
ncbi:MAG: S8 family serine peptidase [Candidatus Nitrosotenuis sp.]